MRLWVSGEGPLVVKLAGIAGGVKLYREEMAEAVRAGYRVAALETTGERRTDRLRVPLTWDFMADEVVAGIEQLGEQRAVLWGTSFGCVLALATAARCPGRVAGLLLCHPPDPLWRPRPYIRLMHWVRKRRRPNVAAAWAFRLVFGALSGWEFLMPAALVRVPELAREGVAAATPGSTLRQKLELLFTEDPGYPPAAVRIPVSIIAGSWDAIAPPGRARRLAQRLPGETVYRRLRFSGHQGAFSRPRAYHKLALQELDRMGQIMNSRISPGDDRQPATTVSESRG